MHRQLPPNTPAVLDEEPCAADPYGWDLDWILDTNRPLEQLPRARERNRPGRPADVPSDLAAILRAQSLCQRCPIFAACQSEVLRRSEHGDSPRSVIWGGIVWGQRGEAWRGEDVPRSIRLAQAASKRESQRLAKTQQLPVTSSTATPSTERGDRSWSEQVAS